MQWSSWAEAWWSSLSDSVPACFCLPAADVLAEQVMSVVLVAVVPLAAALCLVRALASWAWGGGSLSLFSGKPPPQTGRLFVVTGANGGLGKETARMLAMRDARVVMACRDMASAHLAVEDIRRSTGLGELIPMQLDLASLESVYTFAQEVLENFPEIHVLINNAGVSIPDEKQPATEDDIEMHFGVNHLGHFFLTNLLMDRLKESAPSRVINVSSLLHRHGIIDFEHLSTGPPPNQVSGRLPPAYCNSKLCNVYHAMELGQRVGDYGVEVYTLCPGWCYTGLMRHYNFPWYKYLTIIPIAFFFMRSANKGAQCIVHCAVEEKLPKNYGSFGFYRNCRPFISPMPFDQEVSKKLWVYSENLIKAQAPSIVQRALNQY